MTDKKDEEEPEQDASPHTQGDAPPQEDEEEMETGQKNEGDAFQGTEESDDSQEKTEDDASDEYEKLKSENQKLKERLQRIQAEFENFKKRTEKEREEQAKCATEDFLHKLLPVMDNIDLAMNNPHDTEEFVKGTHLIFEQFKKVLADEGLEEVEAEGKTFDPRLHQALLTEDSDEENKVLQVMQKGYTLNGKVLRHAKVKVGKKPQPQESGGEGEDTQEEDESTSQKNDDHDQADQVDTGEESD